MLDGGKLGVCGRFISSGGATGENNPWGERAAAKIGDMADAIVRKKDAQDAKARCAVRARVGVLWNELTKKDLPAPVAPVSKTFMRGLAETIR